MSEPFLGEIRMFAGNFAPRDWAVCNGQILAIAQNTALFSLLGTNYGGNGQTTFALPNLQGAVPMHWGQGPGLSERTIGESGGSATVALISAEMGSHSHSPLASTSAGTVAAPTNAYWSTSSARDKQFASVLPTATMAPANLDPVGGSQPHNNQFPFLVVTYIIALAGIFPQRPLTGIAMEPFLGQISIVGFPFAPRGWALCNGQLLSIAQNQALFSILGTTYGGNGVTTFALPNLQSRAAMHVSNQEPLGAQGGTETVQLNATQIPLHTHIAQAVQAAGTVASPSNAVWAASTGNDLQYATGAADVFMAPNAIGPGGSDQPHSNMPPVTVLNFVIALVGIFPSRN